MEKITKGHPLSQSADIVRENLAMLKLLFPTIVKEGKIDVEELKALLDEDIETSEEYYRLTWAGKNEARREANKPSTATLRPCKEESKNWETTGNIFIEGDNLEVLKLLQKSYAGKIKMMYFDPPYNTGKDFVYKDNYADNLSNYLSLTGQTDDEGKRLSTNTESDGRFHSNWLSMMYPRLKLSRNLLADDGVIFISIDDHEIHNLRKLCDEIFGEENFLAEAIWQHSIQPKGYSGKFSVHHNYNLVYQKSTDFELKSLDRTDEHNKSYSNPDNDPKGQWRTGDVRNALYRPNLIYELKTPSGKIIQPPSNGWRWSKETMAAKIASGEIIFSQDETRIIRKIYLSSVEGRTAETIWFGKEVGTTRDASEEIKDLFDGKSYFDTPKPTKLIKRMAELSINNSDIVLDIFAGSCSTAHAIMELNLSDNGTRKYICVQIPEPTNEDSEAFKAGFKTISDISKERIRRVGSSIISKNNIDIFSSDKTIDIGFKVFKLDSSNITEWDGSVDNLEQNLFNAQSNIKINRSEDDILYEVLLKYGLDLTVPIVEKTIHSCKVFSIGGGVLFVCLSDNITTQVAEAIGKWKEELQPATCRVLFKDNGFADDIAKTNSIQILRQYGIEEANSI